MQINEHVDLIDKYIKREGGYSEATLLDDLNQDFTSLTEIIFKEPLTGNLKKINITTQITELTVTDV